MKTPGTYLEEARLPRPSESPDVEALASFLSIHLEGFQGPLEIRQYTEGYSNLTFLLSWAGGRCILRRPPTGANIRGGHDMSREYRVLKLLKPYFPQVPSALLYCDDSQIIGAPFFLMEKVEGSILRGGLPLSSYPDAGQMHTMSQTVVRMLASLHSIETNGTPLAEIGRPEGYVQRQMEGWVDRYRRSATDDIAGLEETIAWLQQYCPADSGVSLVHNDFKFDNLVFDAGNPSRIVAVLDWEMATLGDPLLDLGTSLAYWSEAGDPPALKPFNVSWLPGSLTRREVVQTYAAMRGTAEPDMLYPYVFGCFKVGVIVQQIYARYRKGLTADHRFAGLKMVLEGCIHQALQAMHKGSIGAS